MGICSFHCRFCTFIQTLIHSHIHTAEFFIIFVGIHSQFLCQVNNWHQVSWSPSFSFSHATLPHFVYPVSLCLFPFGCMAFEINLDSQTDTRLQNHTYTQHLTIIIIITFVQSSHSRIPSFNFNCSMPEHQRVYTTLHIIIAVSLSFALAIQFHSLTTIYSDTREGEKEKKKQSEHTHFPDIIHSYSHSHSQTYTLQYISNNFSVH